MTPCFRIAVKFAILQTFVSPELIESGGGREGGEGGEGGGESERERERETDTQTETERQKQIIFYNIFEYVTNIKNPER